MTFKKTMIAVGLILQWTKESKHRCPPCNQILLGARCTASLKSKHIQHSTSAISSVNRRWRHYFYNECERTSCWQHASLFWGTIKHANLDQRMLTIWQKH